MLRIYPLTAELAHLGDVTVLTGDDPITTNMAAPAITAGHDCDGDSEVRLDFLLVDTSGLQFNIQPVFLNAGETRWQKGEQELIVAAETAKGALVPFRAYDTHGSTRFAVIVSDWAGTGSAVIEASSK